MKEELERLEIAERELDFMVRLSKGRYKSGYKRSGNVEADIAACHREMDEAFSFLGTLPDEEEIPLSDL